MGKRSLDIAELGMMSKAEDSPKAPKKTERSHEENQERAYIAASRRSDRSIEARLQSARAASEVHKKRTGKGFKITEQIVMREEMYEEEDDDLPRHMRHGLSSHLITGNPLFNQRAEAYVTNTVAMSQLQHEHEINAQFARHFPGAQRQLQNMQNMRQPMYGRPLPFQLQPPGAPAAPAAPAAPEAPGYYHHGYQASYAGTPPPGTHPTQPPRGDRRSAAFRAARYNPPHAVSYNPACVF